MKSVLDALQEGRLIELPEGDKTRCLQYLGTLIEAVPEFRSGFDFNAAVATRERAGNTGIGMGWACPHGRVSGEGELLCAIGWSPAGIDYGAPDGNPVRIMVMHYVPDSRKNLYLRELSGLARAIKENPAMADLAGARELAVVRDRLLDLLTVAVERAVPDAKARMIQLEAKVAISATAPALPTDILAGLEILPVTVIVLPGARPIVLAQDKDLVFQLEATPDLGSALSSRLPIDKAGHRIIARSVSPYQPDRLLYDCLAVKVPASMR